MHKIFQLLFDKSIIVKIYMVTTEWDSLKGCAPDYTVLMGVKSSLLLWLIVAVKFQYTHSEINKSSRL